jgi:predicted DNA-binding transcriptional regulator AlpA
LRTLITSEHQQIMDIFSTFVYNLCMMLVMVKEADLDRIEVPEDYEVLDATALGRRLGFKRDTVLAYLFRRNFRRIPRPNRLLAMGPVWYEKSVREWEAKGEDRTRGT